MSTKTTKEKAPKICYSCANAYGCYEALHCNVQNELVNSECKACPKWKLDPEYDASMLQNCREKACRIMRAAFEKRYGKIKKP